jgi:hypothetical protein
MAATWLAKACTHGLRSTHALVAQLDRAPGFEPGGREFESLRARHLRLAAQAQSALDRNQSCLLALPSVDDSFLSRLGGVNKEPAHSTRRPEARRD